MLKRQLKTVAAISVIILATTGAQALTETVNGITWTYFVENGKACLKFDAIPKSTSGSITIPSRLGGYPVVEIEYSAFADRSKLTSVTIPNSVTNIGNSAFSGCSGLTSVTLGNSVKSIGNFAFDGCSGLTGTFAVPDSVTSILGSAFSGCYGLTSVTLGNSVKSIGDFAFSGCYGLTSVTLGNSVTNIVSGAFSDCSGLTSVHISSLAAWCGISFGDSYANPLYYAKHIFVNGNEITNLAIPSGVARIKDYTFSNCDGITAVSIPNSVMNIGKSAFSNCDGLTSLTVPDSVTNIEESAFNSCKSLRSVTIGNSIKTIGSSAFYDCDHLASVHISSLAAWCGISFGDSYANPLYYAKHIFVNGNEITNLAIPSVVASVNDYTFYNCDGITAVSIPNSVTNIGNYAFYDCDNLASAIIGNGVKRVGNYAFCFCDNLTSMTLGSDIATIGDYAFYYCSKLTSVAIPNSVTKIGKYAFFCCLDLTSLTIGNSVTDIGDYAFKYCSELTSLTIPSSVTEIGIYAFEGCSKLETLYLPKRFEGNTFDFGIPDGCTVIFVKNESIYMVTLDMQGGSNGSSSVTATYGSAMPAITVPTRTGYTFGGYYTATYGGGTQYYTETGASARNWNKTSNTTLYAKWSANTYTITFDANGGTFSSSAHTATATFGSALPDCIPAPTKEASIFQGWAAASSNDALWYGPNGEKQLSSYGIAGDVTLLAQWEQAVSLDTTGYTRSMNIFVAGYTGSSTLAHFPVLVRLSPSIAGFRYADFAGDNGGDLVFTDSDGNVIPHEIDTWNTNGESLVWVKLPSMAKNTAFRAYWGRMPDTANDPTAVWSSYVGVWHMGEDTGNAIDATGHGYDGVPMGNLASGMVAYEEGAVGRARTNRTGFDGTAYLSLTNSGSMTLGAKFYVSGWFRANGEIGNASYPRLASRKQVYNDSNGWEFHLSKATTNLTARGASTTSLACVLPSCVQRWLHLGVAYDGISITVNANGTNLAFGSITTATDNGYPISFGNNSNGSEASFNGQYDEIRIAKMVPSEDWAQAEYRSMAVADFVKAQPVENLAEPRTFHVDAANGDDKADGLSWATALATIQRAINLACTDDEILVADGVYSPIASGNLGVTIRSVNGAATTVIDGGGTNRCATLGGSTNDVVKTTLVGFTLRNGRNDSGAGAQGGILENCFLMNNHAVRDYDEAWEGCGGGMIGSIAKRCTILGNVAKENGGGAYLSMLMDCLLANNTALNCASGPSGGGIMRCKATRCTVVDNHSVSGQSPSPGGAGADACILESCIVHGNTFTAGAASDAYNCTATYSCFGSSVSGTGNIIANPMFADAANGDYRLSIDSPCIDAGLLTAEAENGTDLDGNARWIGTGVDMGCYEYGAIQIETQTADVPVPYDWLRDYYPEMPDKYDSYKTAAKADAANGVNKVWECYVVGISPTNATEVFRTVILWVNGEPKISWEPKLAPEEEAKRVYTEIGKTNLNDNGWTEVSPANRDGMRFFKVKVEMK